MNASEREGKRGERVVEKRVKGEVGEEGGKRGNRVIE